MSTLIENDPVVTETNGDVMSSQADDKDSPRRLPKKKTVVQKIGKSILMTMRRVHLYSGLFMFPWVLLYGFTGWFFNHPGYFTGDQVQSVSLLDSTAANQSLPSPDDVASRVVEEINIQSFLVGGPELELAEQAAAHFDRYLSFNVVTDTQSHQVTIDPFTGRGDVRTTFIDPTQPEPATAPEQVNPLTTVPSVDVAENTQSVAAELLPEALQRLGLDSGEVTTGRFSSSLIFSAVVDGRPSQVTYNMGTGAITAIADDAKRPPMETKSFLQRLHLSRGYSPSWSSRLPVKNSLRDGLENLSRC